jgi:hypothetical protein
MQNDNQNNDSLLTNLKNKVNFMIYNAVTDPNANKFAEERQKNKENKNTPDSGTQDATSDNSDNSPNFSIKRLAIKVYTQTIEVLKIVIFPFIALMLAMIVANEAIIYSVPIRIIFFVCVLLVCIYSKVICVLLAIFYTIKGGYSYYVNNMTDIKSKQEIMPTIYTLLPISTYKPMTTLSAFLMYPFVYPKTVNAEKQLPITMETYWNNLEKSFNNFDKMKTLPIIANKLQNLKKKLLELHNPTVAVVNTPPQSQPITATTATTAATPATTTTI